MIGKKEMDGWLKLKGLAAAKSPGKSLVESALASLTTDDTADTASVPAAHPATAPEALSDLWSPEDDPHNPEQVADFGQALLEAGIITAAQLSNARHIVEKNAGA